MTAGEEQLGLKQYHFKLKTSQKCFGFGIPLRKICIMEPENPFL